MASDPSSGTLPLFDGRTTPETDEAPTVRFAAGAPAPPNDPPQPPPAPAGSGRLVQAAWPLLSLLARIAAGSAPANTEQLKTGSAGLVRDFERVAMAEGTNPREVAAARYVLCTALDEAVLVSPWGASTGWNNSSLLSAFHNETWGGEKVFTLIERALADPAQYADLLELCHFVMLLGFQGKYRLARDGSAQADALRRRLYDLLHARLGAPAAIPVPQPEVARRRGRITPYVPVWSVAAVCTLIAAVVFGWLDYRLSSESNAVAGVVRDLSTPAAAGSGSAVAPAGWSVGGSPGTPAGTAGSAPGR